MRLAKKLATAAAVAVLSSGCYHAVIETGRPAGGTVVTNEWAHSFIAGLIPPQVVNVASQCPGGVSKVETQHSFLNMLAQFVTFSLYSPMTITVTCSGGGSADASAPTVRVGENASAEERTAAFQKAIDMSTASGQAVLVQF